VAFRPGQIIARRYRMRDITTWAQAAVVVADGDDGLLLWQTPGGECALYGEPGGRSIADAPIDELVGASIVRTTWQRHGVLMLHPVAASYSVWWFFTGERFDGWYVNLEAPYTRRATGIDTTDQVLDLVVDPGLGVTWKDEEEFTARTGHPWYWNAAQAREIRATAERVAAVAASGSYPFDGIHCGFRPDPAWGVPELPVGWDQSVHVG
jgi:hypothetical protein